MDAVSKYLGSYARVEDTDPGLHVAAWINNIPGGAEQQMLAETKQRGVGIWSVSPRYSRGLKFRKERCAGFALGYASLKKSDINKGIRLLADTVRWTRLRWAAR